MPDARPAHTPTAVHVVRGATWVRARAGGREVATARVTVDGPVGFLHIHVVPGHLSREVRRDLVDAVFELSEVRAVRDLRVSLPLGDPELLNGLRAHCEWVRTRTAGVTCLAEARMPGMPGPDPDGGTRPGPDREESQRGQTGSAGHR